MNDAPRKLLYSRRHQAGGRWYFFEVREAVDGSKYITISEAIKVNGTWRRNRVMVFDDHLQVFEEGLCAAIQFVRSPSPSTGTYSIAEVRVRHPRAYLTWPPDEDARLLALHREGAPVAVIAAELQRQPGAVRSRLSKLTGRRRIAPPNPLTEWKRIRPRGGRAWESADDEALLADLAAGLPIEEIANRLGRGVFSVQVRLCKLGRGESVSDRKPDEPPHDSSD